mmetsp:Transcript_8959/g.19363  ORF Transcript_8959/g.19363 Transcript_8959/m.19363 type:complete len:83 (+) Transcript_8959:868-1116(+)
MKEVTMLIPIAKPHESLTCSVVAKCIASAALPNTKTDAQNKTHQNGNVMEILVNSRNVKMSFSPPQVLRAFKQAKRLAQVEK